MKVMFQSNVFIGELDGKFLLAEIGKIDPLQERL